MSIEQLRNELQSMERQRQEKKTDERIAIRKKDSGRIRDLRREIRGCNKVIAFINKRILEIEKKTSKPGHSNSDPTPEKTVEEQESDNTPDHWDSSAGEDDENDEDYEDDENDEDYGDYENYEDYKDDNHNTGKTHKKQKWSKFDDENDAARWIERVCNLFISQRLTVLFRGMEATLKDGGFDEWLESNEAYNLDLEGANNKKLRDMSSKQREQWHKSHVQQGEAEAEAEPWVLEEWEVLAIKRGYLGFYKFFNAVQLQLRIKPFADENNQLEVMIEAKNREYAFSNHLMLLSTQVQKQQQRFDSMASVDPVYSIASFLNLYGDALPEFELQPNIVPDIVMLCLQAIFHANTCMLDFYSSMKNPPAHKNFNNLHKHFIQICVWPLDEEVKTQMKNTETADTFAMVIYTLLCDQKMTRDGFCYILQPEEDSDKKFLCISGIDLYQDESSLQRIDETWQRVAYTRTINATDLWHMVYEQSMATFPGDKISAIRFGFVYLNQTLSIIDTHAIVCMGWPLNYQVRDALQAGIMCALTAKQTHAFSEIPKNISWQAQAQAGKTYLCPGWAWWHVLLQLHAEEELFDNEAKHSQHFSTFYEILADTKDGNSVLTNKDSSFSRHGVSHLLLALAEFGSYDTMMFGDASMNLLTLFLSCIVSTIQEEMLRNLIQLNSLDKDRLTPNSWTDSDMKVLCTRLLNVVCGEYCKKKALKNNANTKWWHTCVTENIENIDEEEKIITPQSEIFTQIMQEYDDLFFTDISEDTQVHNLSMKIATAMLMLYDIRSSGTESEMRTQLLEFSRNVHKNAGYANNDTVSYESMSQRYSTNLQHSINSEFRYYINSAVGRAMLCFCGCTDMAQSMIEGSLSQTNNTTEFIKSIQGLQGVAYRTTTGTHVAGVESRANVREMAWDKMVAWRTEQHRADTITRQKLRDKDPDNATLRIPINRQIDLHDALEQNNYVDEMHTMLLKMKELMTDDIMYQCFMQNCCQVQKTDDEMFMKAGMELWMPVIIKNSISDDDKLKHRAWYDYIKQDPTHKSEPRLEIGLHMLTLARAYYEDCAKYDSMLRHRSSIHTRDRVQNTIARPNEQTKQDPGFNIEQR